MKVTYDLELGNFSEKRVKNPTIKEVIKFVNSSHKNACIEFDTVKEARSNLSNVRVYAKRHNIGVEIHVHGNKIYFIKKE